MGVAVEVQVETMFRPRLACILCSCTTPDRPAARGGESASEALSYVNATERNCSAQASASAAAAGRQRVKSSLEMDKAHPSTHA